MKNTTKAILLPVDFKDHGVKAINYAKKLANELDGCIHLLHVIEYESWWAEVIKDNKEMNALTKKALNKLKEIKYQHQLGDDVEMKVMAGRRHDKIMEYANRLNPRYIVMADNYPFSHTKKILGSTVNRLVTEACQPVITLSEPAESILKNIVLPLDLTQNVRLKLFNSVAMALNHNAKIHLVSFVSDKSNQISKIVQEKLDKFKRTYDENGIKYSTEILSKKDTFAYKEVLEYADSKDVDSILVMTHKESARFDNYIGAFAYHIINECKLPVISITGKSAQSSTTHITSHFLDPLGLFR